MYDLVLSIKLGSCGHRIRTSRPLVGPGRFFTNQLLVGTVGIFSAESATKSMITFIDESGKFVKNDGWSVVAALTLTHSFAAQARGKLRLAARDWPRSDGELKGACSAKLTSGIWWKFCGSTKRSCTLSPLTSA